jgi:hypothetical protein
MRILLAIMAVIAGLSALSIVAPTPAEAQYYGGGYGHRYYKPRYYAPRYYAPPPVYYAPRYYAPRYGY